MVEKKWQDFVNKINSTEKMSIGGSNRQVGTSFLPLVVSTKINFYYLVAYVLKYPLIYITE